MKQSHSVLRVAILVETTRSYTRDLLSGVRRYLDSHGPWSTFLELRALDSSVPPWLENWDGDGVLTRTHSHTMAEAIRKTGVPSVELRSTRLTPGLPFVGMDNALIGEQVAEHFLHRGYRRFGAYTLDTEAFFEERISNFVTCISRAGLTCEILPSQGEASPGDWESHQEALVQWLDSLEKPVGIFAANDQLGVRLLDACQRTGIAVPEEVAVVGCENDTTLCDFASPTLTSVSFDGKAVGFRAAEILDQWMRGEEPEAKPFLVPPREIIVRGSSDEFVIEDPVVLRAVRLIREEALSGITVGEICARLNLSRSTLDRHMKQTFNRGTKEEIQRIRFREVNRLLRSTNLTLEVISEMTGFSHAHYLSEVYRKRFGITPGHYRRRSATT